MVIGNRLLKLIQYCCGVRRAMHFLLHPFISYRCLCFQPKKNFLPEFCFTSAEGCAKIPPLDVILVYICSVANTYHETPPVESCYRFGELCRSVRACIYRLYYEVYSTAGQCWAWQRLSWRAGAWRGEILMVDDTPRMGRYSFLSGGSVCNSDGSTYRSALELDKELSQNSLWLLRKENRRLTRRFLQTSGQLDDSLARMPVDSVRLYG